MQTLVDDFICALRRRVLYQGRMYVFEHYCCFYSNIFGHLKIVTIPLKVGVLGTETIASARSRKFCPSYILLLDNRQRSSACALVQAYQRYTIS